jgi:hypothetical protein
MLSNRVREMTCVVTIAWVGIVMPVKVLVFLWQLRQIPSTWQEIIPLCFLIAMSVGLVVETVRRAG